MSLAEVLGVILSLISMGAVIVTALLGSVFVGIRSRIDRLEQKVEDNHNRLIEKIVDLNKEMGKK